MTWDEIQANRRSTSHQPTKLTKQVNQVSKPSKQQKSGIYEPVQPENLTGNVYFLMKTARHSGCNL